MSPEQAQGRTCDARSDIFSLGVVLYELLAGMRPFEGTSAVETLHQIVHQPMPPLDEPTPVAVRMIVEKALEKDPDDRYQFARELAVDLRRAARRGDARVETVVVAAASVPHGRRWLPVAAGMLLTAGALAVAAWWAWPRGGETLLRFEIAPPPGGQFVIGGATFGGLALSPDGEQLAFVASVNSTALVWVRSLDDGTARPIAGTQSAQRPFWSPDGKSIAYFGQEGLRRVGVPAGTNDLIVKIDTSLPCAGSWSSDDQILFNCGGSGIRVVPAYGGEVKQLTENGGFPQALPGGAFLYLAPGPPFEVRAATIADPTGRRIMTADSPALFASGHLLWRIGSALFAQPFDSAALKLSGEARRLLEPVASGSLADSILTVSATGRMVYDAAGNDLQASWYDRSGKRLGPVGRAGSFQGVRLFDAGRRLMTQANAVGDRGLWLIDEQGRALRPIAGDVTVSPTPSPDGKSVVFTVPTEKEWLMQRAGVAGDDRVTVLAPDPAAFKFVTDWAADLVLLSVVSQTSRIDIWSLRVNPDGTPAPGAVAKPYLQTLAQESDGRIAPAQSPRWVAYVSDESGQVEVYLQSFPASGEKLAISSGGGGSPVWGPGGRELYYVTPDNTLMVVDVTLGPTSASASSPRELFPLPFEGPAVSPPYDTLDGKRFVVLSPVAPATRPMKAITNWPALLKQ
ncbi:MAG TPA: protein kinase [Gemmatimonadales bacterium]|nr:protein kinase [Gemmatimonadales bacterium]